MDRENVPSLRATLTHQRDLATADREEPRRIAPGPGFRGRCHIRGHHVMVRVQPAQSTRRSPGLRNWRRHPTISGVKTILSGIALHAVLCTSFVHAQTSVVDLERQFDDKLTKATAAAEGAMSFERYRELVGEFAKSLEAYLAGAADADDATHGRTILVQLYLETGAPDKAKSALQAVVPAKAPMLDLLIAAALTSAVGLEAKRDAWIDAALAKEAPFRARMEAGLLLMTQLHEPARAIALFERELEAAKDDATRAEVLWHSAVAIREREDRGEGDYEKALSRLAKTYPQTPYGAIAADRLRAMAFEVGADFVPLAGTTLEGEQTSLAALRGQVVLVYAWRSDVPMCTRELPIVNDLVAQFGEQGFTVLGMNLDDDKKAATAAVREHGITWPSLFDGEGFDSPHALRTNTEQVPHMYLVDRAGKVAALRLTFFGEEEVKHAQTAIRRCLASK